MVAYTRSARPGGAQTAVAQDTAALRSPAPPQAIWWADGTPIRVLVVDDDPSLAEPVASVLRYEGPGGLELMRRIQADSPHACVLSLTAWDGVEDRVSGITSVRGDYVTKPLSLEEVPAPLLGLLWRAGLAWPRGGHQLAAGDLRAGREPLIRTLRGVSYVLRPAS